MRTTRRVSHTADTCRFDTHHAQKGPLNGCEPDVQVQVHSGCEKGGLLDNSMNPRSSSKVTIKRADEAATRRCSCIEIDYSRELFHVETCPERFRCTVLGDRMASRMISRSASCCRITDCDSRDADRLSPPPLNRRKTIGDFVGRWLSHESEAKGRPRRSELDRENTTKSRAKAVFHTGAGSCPVSRQNSVMGGSVILPGEIISARAGRRRGRGIGVYWRDRSVGALYHPCFCGSWRGRTRQNLGLRRAIARTIRRFFTPTRDKFITCETGGISQKNRFPV